MPTLSKELRRTLENAVVEARKVAEAGAELALRDQLAVDHEEPWPRMTPDERGLRNRLRDLGRQLGDRLDSQRGTQTLNHLRQACAYEHWHRMLFARFLSENNLLLHPEYAEPVSLDEIKELARAQGVDWLTLSAEFAQQMLIEVFRSDDPALEVDLPPETRQRLEEILGGLQSEVFTGTDSLGWVYQFWQRDEKERINKSEDSIGADQLSPVTQLFTEDYMVLYLLHNTLGAWWTAKRRTENKPTELPGYDWTYLRSNEDGTPAAGAYEGWPGTAKELRVIDPCMGSGHFLTFTLPILARMRAEEEGLHLVDAVDAVLRDNVFGLELDARCSQIAAFNLALTAWRLAGKYFPLPKLGLACAGLGINAPESEWIKLAGDDGRARQTMQKLYALFRQAPILGSLIDPTGLGQDLFAAEFAEVAPLLEVALGAERHNRKSSELAIAAQGVLATARMLISDFTLVATNVPYLLKAKQCEELQNYCDRYARDATADLATIFLERCARLCSKGGSHATVTPQNWLFLKSYSTFRRRLLTSQEVHHVAAVGSGATATASWDVLRALLISSPGRVSRDYTLTGVDTDAAKEEQRALDLRANSVMTTSVGTLLDSASCRIALAASAGGMKLSVYASSLQGLSTGDNPRFQGHFWEFLDFDSVWAFQQGVVSQSMHFGGRENVVRWEKGEGELVKSEGSAIRGTQALGKGGVVISRMRSLPATIYSGTFFDINVAVILPRNQQHIAAIWAYCSSPEFSSNVRKLDKKLNVTNATLAEVPFDLHAWQATAEQRYPTGLPQLHSTDPAQWIFSGHPKGSDRPLQVAVARLVGYKWPRQSTPEVPGCHSVGLDGLEDHTDANGIVCLSSIQGALSAADRLRALLGDAFGTEWSASKLAELLGNYSTLEQWLRDRFFAEHCELFDQRPFVWHVWDGRKDGFHALVNYQRLAAPNGGGRKTLERLIYTVLGDWITRQRAEIAASIDGADARLTAAQNLQSELEKILAGDPPFDIFVRWKPTREQPLGWEPDLNDGIRINIRPWLITSVAGVGNPKKGTCVLRTTPNISYGKDRGKEPSRDKTEFPWFADSTDRVNDIHLSLDDKRTARERRNK